MAVLFFSGTFLTHDKNSHIRTARSCCGAAAFKDKSLQVPPPGVKCDARSYLEKRVLPFISRKVPASLTVEAAIAMPLFLFFSFALLSPIRWMDEQRKMQTGAEQICEDLSRWAYVEATEKEGIEENGDRKEIEKTEIVGEINGGEMVQYETAYIEKIPFFSGVLSGVQINIGAQRRKWIGLDGKLRDGESGGEDDGSDEEMVYVGAGMGRYHLSRDCHYLSNRYEAVSIENVEAMCTSDGRRLKPCGSCKPPSSGDGTVYITARGEHYHSTTSCTAMVSYVRKVPLREVEYLGVCSYCGGGA